MSDMYVHGYAEKESYRLSDQANTLVELLHRDTFYPADSRVLEAGCGIGAQTVFLAANSPDSRIVSIDVAPDSIKEAKIRADSANIKNVSFQSSNIFDLPFKKKIFDHIFVCFVLEHLENPVKALKSMKGVLKEEGTITVIEGDHGSFFCHPESSEARQTVQCLIDLQARMGGNSLVGRQIYPLLKEAGFEKINVSPRFVYVDSSRPDLVEGFTKNTFIAMVEGVREQALSMGMIDERSWNKGIADLYSTMNDNGTFCYTFFKGVGFSPKNR